MEDITAAIMNEIERSDPQFIARDVGIEVYPKALFEKKKHLRVFGVVHSEEEKNLVLRVAQDHAGNSYDIVDELRVH
jgi:hypothetical protein